MWNHLDLGDDDNEEEAAWRTSWQEDSHWMLKLTDEELLETDDDELSEDEASLKPLLPSNGTVLCLHQTLPRRK
jgi:hypothetical protein